MNHDYAHCVGFGPDCPKKCFRAQLVRDLKLHITDIRLPVTWLDFRGTTECMKKDGDLVSNCGGCPMHPDMEQAER